MLHLLKPNRKYDPETIALRTAAFDMACQSVPPRTSGNDDVRRTLASIILRHVDRGERDPVRLSNNAFSDLVGVYRSATGEYPLGDNPCE
jgi:hypothetical protein